MKKFSIFLLLTIFFGKILFAGTGYVRFENTTDLMVMEIDTNTKESKGISFKEKGKSWADSTKYDKQRTLEAGEDWKIKLEGPALSVPNIKPTIKVWYKEKTSDNYKGSYTWNGNIDVANDKTTVVQYKWDKNAAVPLQRKIYEPEKDLKNTETPKKVKEEFGKDDGGIGMLRLTNNTGHDIMVKYKIAEAASKTLTTGLYGVIAASFDDDWITRKIDKNDSEKWPTGNKDQDIRDMVVGYAGKDAPDGWFATTSNNKNFALVPRRLFSENVKIFEGKTTNVVFTKDAKTNLVERQIAEKAGTKDAKELKKEDGSFYDQDKVIIINTTDQDFRITLGADAAKNLKYNVDTIGDFFSPDSSIILEANSIWRTDSIHQSNKNKNIDNLLKDAMSSDIKGVQLTKHIKGDKYIIVDIQEFATYKKPDFKDFVGIEDKMKIQANKSTIMKIYRGEDGRFKVAVTEPI
jgi:hypothetical protein